MPVQQANALIESRETRFIFLYLSVLNRAFGQILQRKEANH